jgi:peptidoglycan/LPS O-acetylase OafA/YrhL
MTPTIATHDRVDILDGWRALSILLVLAGHLLPLGPKAWELNEAVAATGMVVFFNLSGFLIVRMLLANPDPINFLIRRVFRILPLAWVAMLILIVATQPDATTITRNLLFYSNLPPANLLHGGEHLWSLCIEVQFYVAIAALVAVAGRRGLFILPVIAAAITILRIVQDAPISIFTWQRVDEILAGCIIALLYDRGVLQRIAARLPSFAPLIFLALAFAAAHPQGGFLAYGRPYFSAAAVGFSIVTAPALMRRLFTTRTAVYIATISYALYIVHGMLSETWLGAGDKLEKYAKRPVLIALTFLLAHLSTFYFENRMIAVGKRLTTRRKTTRTA